MRVKFEHLSQLHSYAVRGEALQTYRRKNAFTFSTFTHTYIHVYMRFGRTNNENELDGLNAVTFSQNITVMLISVYGFLVLPFGDELPMPF